MERDGPLATGASFLAVIIVVLLATRRARAAPSRVMLVARCSACLDASAAPRCRDTQLNFLNFIALPITFGIGCEYPFNIFDRSRLLGATSRRAVKRIGGAVALCSYTTMIGYGSLLFADNQALQSFGGRRGARSPAWSARSSSCPRSSTS